MLSHTIRALRMNERSVIIICSFIPLDFQVVNRYIQNMCLYKGLTGIPMNATYFERALTHLKSSSIFMQGKKV